MRLPILLNTAACHLALKDWSDAIICCSEVWTHAWRPRQRCPTCPSCAPYLLQAHLH